MATKLIPLVCPNCGGEIHIAEGTKQFYCSYCGTQLLLDTEEKSFFFTKHVINEAKMIEAQGRSRAMVIDAKERARIDRMQARNDRIRARSDSQSKTVETMIRLMKWELLLILGMGIFFLIMKIVSLT